MELITSSRELLAVILAAVSHVSLELFALLLQLRVGAFDAEAVGAEVLQEDEDE